MGGERALTFACQGEPLVAVLHLPERQPDTGIVVIVGGPQYRVGSHRQYVLFSRYAARRGIATFRFDHRGIGDSGGNVRSFLQLGEDIEAAISEFCRQCPEIDKIFLLGLCDAASAAMLYAYKDKRVTGLILLNPWVRSEASLARAHIRFYYARRVLDAGAWLALAREPSRIVNSLSSIVRSVAAVTRHMFGEPRKGDCDRIHREELPQANDAHFPDDMRRCLSKFRGRMLLILSGQDITAAEFRELVDSDTAWRTIVNSEAMTCKQVEMANHTFSTGDARDQVAEEIVDWLGA